VPLWTLLGVCCLLPLAWMLWVLIQHPNVLGEFHLSGFRARLLGRTLLYNGMAAALATLLGLPAALVVGRGRGRLALALTLLLPLALVMPSIAYSYGWIQCLRLLGIHLRPADWPDVIRCVWTLASWLWPLPALLGGAALRLTDSQVQQQALLDGALWRITLRQLAAPMLLGFAIVMLLAMQEFSVWERTGISVVATEVRTVFDGGPVRSEDPAAIAAVDAGTGRTLPRQLERSAAALTTALPMLTIVLLAAVAVALLARRMLSADGVETGGWPAVLNAGWLPALLAAAVLALTLLVPTSCMVISISSHRWTFSMDRDFMPLRIWLWAWPYATGTLLIGALAGLGAACLSMLACVRRSPWGLVAATIVFLVGGELLAIATIRIYNRATPWPLSFVRVSGHDLFGWVYNSFPAMFIVHMGRFGWLGLLAGYLTWSRPFSEIRDACAVDGAGPWRACWHVLWPVASPLLLAAALLVAILAMTEVPASTVLAPQRPQMLVPTLMGWVHMQRHDDMLEGTLLLMGLALVFGVGFVLLAWAGLRLTRSLAAVRSVSSEG